MRIHFEFHHLKMRMLNIGEITNEEVAFFNGLLNMYPDQVFIRTEHGFDMSSSIQVTIDLSNILQVAIPAIVAAIQAVLVYRIQKKQNELMEKKLEADEKEVQKKQDNGSKHEFEVTVSFDEERRIIIKNKDLEMLSKEPENMEALLKKVVEVLLSIK